MEELGSLETGVGNSGLNTFGVERPLPPAGGTAAEIDTVTDSQKLISVIINFDAEIMYCFPHFFPGTPAEESALWREALRPSGPNFENAMSGELR